MEELKAAGALVVTEVIKNLAKDMASFLKEKIKGYYSDTTNKELIESGWAFEDYLGKVYDKYSKSKSILYRNEARNLYDFFVPVDLKYESEITDNTSGLAEIYTYLEKKGFDSRHISGKELADLLKEGNRIIITGVGGLGKTMHLKHFCINAIERGLKIPIFISLRWFNECDIESETLEKLIYDNLCTFGFKLEYRFFLYSLDSNRYIFLFDGFDEITSPKQHQLAIKIQNFAERYSDNSFIISSRQIERIYAWDEFKVLALCLMNREQSIRLIWKLDFPYDRRKRFISLLDDAVYKKYESFISVPLLLSLLYLTYEDNTILPETLQEYYEKALETMLYRHDFTKVGFVRKLKSGLSYEDFKEVFYNFCFRTYFRDIYSFTETSLLSNISAALKKANKSVDEHAYKSDLVDVACMIIRDAMDYTFIHRSFQEYFAARYVSHMTDAQQRQFCIGFMKACSDKMLSFSDHNSYSFNSSSKVLDFMKMLHGIEPRRFDYIVILPILEKIYHTFLACDKDLISTTSRFFQINVENYDNCGLNEFVTCFKCHNGKNENRINIGELRVLYYYKSRWEEYVNIENDIDIKKFVDNNMYRLYEELVNNNLEKKKNRTVYFIFNESLSLVEITRGLIIFIKASLLKYHNLLSQDQNKLAFDDMLDSF